jgi:TolB protein
VDLYLVDPATRRLADRLTRSKANEASPSWSPDGRSLVYVSDEGGVPRCYTMDLASRAPRRLVWSSAIRESVAPEWGADGRVVFCGRAGGRYGIYVADPAGNTRTAVLKPISPSDGADYEDPSWAPDGRHVVCTRTAGWRRSLVVLDTEGDPARRLFDVPGDWYLPSWSANGVARP